MSVKPCLENIGALWVVLRDPHDRFRFIYIEGTNGKGSTSIILLESGYTTGLYTSPYILRFSKKIKVNGKEITEGEIIDFLKRIYEAEQTI